MSYPAKNPKNLSRHRAFSAGMSFPHDPWPGDSVYANGLTWLFTSLGTWEVVYQ